MARARLWARLGIRESPHARLGSPRSSARGSARGSAGYLMAGESRFGLVWHRAQIGSLVSAWCLGSAGARLGLEASSVSRLDQHSFASQCHFQSFTHGVNLFYLVQTYFTFPRIFFLARSTYLARACSFTVDCCTVYGTMCMGLLGIFAFTAADSKSLGGTNPRVNILAEALNYLSYLHIIWYTRRLT